MKKAGTILVIITLIFLSFLGGLFLGRNMDKSEVRLSRTAPKETAVSTEPTVPTETSGGEHPLPGKIDINTASAEDLSNLPGIGEVLARRICDYRAEHGPFQTLHQLTEVEGIGEKRLEAILDYITLDAGP